MNRWSWCRSSRRWVRTTSGSTPDFRPSNDCLRSTPVSEKKSIATAEDDDLSIRHAIEDGRRCVPRLGRTISHARADDPADPGDTVVSDEPKHRPTAADLDIVGVRAEDQDVEAGRRLVGERQAAHAGAFAYSAADGAASVGDGAASSSRTCQTAHGGRPASYRASRFCMSLRVSIGAQKPSCG